jgi:hypothetical protein
VATVDAVPFVEKALTLIANFSPQPYPLYAIPLNRVDDPTRFELTSDPIRLVLGWVTDDAGAVLPALAGGAPSGTVWEGPVFYEETRDRAEQTAKTIDKADRASVRDARMLALFHRWDAWAERVGDRVEQRPGRTDDIPNVAVPPATVPPETDVPRLRHVGENASELVVPPLPETGVEEERNGNWR